MSRLCVRPSPALRLSALGIALLLVGGCFAPRPDRSALPHAGGLHALLLNGGGSPQVNYRSHLQHLLSLVDLLQSNGVRADDIVIFSGDGADPAPDLVTRELPGEADFWILPRSVRQFLRPPTVLVNSSIEGFSLRPAQKDGLRDWFSREGRQLEAGDTLLLYVTDHGKKNPDNLANNTISLWGEDLSVEELRDLLSLLDPAVRVVLLMSQCYGGSFAGAVFDRRDDVQPVGNVCGYFASTAERPAYGCYAQNRGKDGVGHSYHFFEAAELLGDFREAHRRVLETDDTPDVPHTGADFFLEQLLRKAAESQGEGLETFADELLAKAWQDRGRWELEIRLLDRIGRAFGSFSPRSLAELGEQAKTLPQLSRRLGTYSRRWREALESLRIENMKRFLEAHPSWRKRLGQKNLRRLSPEDRRRTASQLLAEVAPFVRAAPRTHERLVTLRRKVRDASDASYRMQVRLGAILRMRMRLTSIAARVYLEQEATPEQRAGFERLAECQDLRLTDDPVVSSADAAERPAPYPPLAEEERLLAAVMPAWMGISYRPVGTDEAEQEGVQAGAVKIVTVYANSPAEEAGLEVGDLVLGPPGATFNEPHQVREWTMRHEIGDAAALQVRRRDREMRVTLHPGPYPLELPKLPGPPKIGSVAPPLEPELFRGAMRLSFDQPRLLFFWATWCSICKAALPELLAFGRERGVEVVAITDESPQTLQRFFAQFEAPFPAVVATDRHRDAFRSYGVSGTPTFVLVDGGVVRHYQTGYSRRRGITIDGWQFGPRAAR